MPSSQRRAVSSSAAVFGAFAFKDPRVAASYEIEALRIFDHYEFRLLQQTRPHQGAQNRLMATQMLTLIISEFEADELHALHRQLRDVALQIQLALIGQQRAILDASSRFGGARSCRLRRASGGRLRHNRCQCGAAARRASPASWRRAGAASRPSWRW